VVVDTVSKLNLHDAISQKKARIVEIGRTLSKYPLEIHRLEKGEVKTYPTRPPTRLEEQRQHLLIEVAELEREAIPQFRRLQEKITTGATLEADSWRDFHDKFMSLASDERALLQRTRKDRALRAHCDYKDHPEAVEMGKPEQGFFCLLHTPECGVWNLNHGPSENFQAEFRALATRAGRALGAPQGALLEDFWLHRLFLDLRGNGSDELIVASDEGGIILHVCIASATFCSRLEKKALETSASSPKRAAARDKVTAREPEVAKRRALVKSNPDVVARDMCEIFDRNRVPLPPKWPDAGFQSWSKAHKNHSYRKRIDVMISKDKKTN
jgi:hypothetical protein